MSLRATADTRRSEPVEVAAAELDLTAYVRPGDRLVWGQGPAEPHSLTSALVEQRAAIVGDGERLDIFLAVTLGDSMRAEYAEQFRYFGLGGLGQTSRLTKAGAVEVMPTRLGAVTRLIRSGRLRFDVVLVQLSEPRDGVCSTGLVGDMLQDAIRTARVVIGEINPHVPFSRGDTQVPLRDLDVVVRSDAPLPQWPAARVSPDAQRIAEQIAELVPDGATLQMGIGAIPEAFAAAATGKRDLAIHSGMVGDAVIELVESGAVTNARKPIDTGVSVTGLAFGTERLVRWIDDNPEVVLRSIDHTHGIRPLSALPDLWAINSADGTEKWAVPLNYLAQTPPSVTPEGLVIAGGGPGSRGVQRLGRRRADLVAGLPCAPGRKGAVRVQGRHQPPRHRGQRHRRQQSAGSAFEGRRTGAGLSRRDGRFAARPAARRSGPQRQLCGVPQAASGCRRVPALPAG